MHDEGGISGGFVAALVALGLLGGVVYMVRRQGINPLEQLRIERALYAERGERRTYHKGRLRKDRLENQVKAQEQKLAALRLQLASTR